MKDWRNCGRFQLLVWSAAVTTPFYSCFILRRNRLLLNTKTKINKQQAVEIKVPKRPSFVHKVPHTGMQRKIWNSLCQWECSLWHFLEVYNKRWFGWMNRVWSHVASKLKNTKTRGWGQEWMSGVKLNGCGFMSATCSVLHLRGNADGQSDISA